MFRLSSYRPNPFRSITPRIQHWLFPLFYRHNDWHLQKKFSLKAFLLSDDDAAILKRIRETPGGHVIVANHTSFMEPHVMMEVLRLGDLKPSSMAGSDVLEGLYGFQGWYLSLSGALSVDRGILDKRALMVAQEVLDEQIDPLIVYPEGEADYTNRIVRPFQTGAFTFALKHAERNTKPNNVTWLTPIAIRYSHLDSPEKLIRESIQTLLSAVTEDYPGITIPEALSPSTDIPIQLSGLTQMAVQALCMTHPQLANNLPFKLNEQLEHVRLGLLKSLCQEHAPDLLESLSQLGHSETMGLKNRLRSLIVRVAYAPERADVEKAIALLEKSHKQPAKKALKTIRHLEYHWLGLGISRYYEAESLQKRQMRLAEHLKHILPWSDKYALANDEDKARWQRQINETRQIKLLWLLQEDLERRDTSWDGLDETLVKLEILMKSWFRYRGNKAVSFRVGNPIDIQAFLAQNSELSKRERLQKLTDLTHQTIQTMVDELYTHPLAQRQERAAKDAVGSAAG